MRRVPLCTGNRIVGLLNELQEVIETEESSIELWRLHYDLRALANAARWQESVVESRTRQLEHAQNARPVRSRKRKWRLA